MGFFNKVKEQAADAVSEHGGKIGDAVDKAVDFVDEKTGGHLGDKGDAVADQAKDALGIDEEPPA